MTNEIFALGLSDGEIAVYAYLLFCEDRETHLCYPSFRKKDVYKRQVHDHNGRRIIGGLKIERNFYSHNKVPGNFLSLIHISRPSTRLRTSG